ncbi:DNA-binding protein [Yersinia frederiksenii]|nr:DNA-binding protein [Yersinia frederiksenii]
MEPETLDTIIKGIGIPVVAKACRVSNRAVYKWLHNGFLPKTEFFGKTKYAQQIERASKGKHTADKLLQISREKLLSV